LRPLACAGAARREAEGGEVSDGFGGSRRDPGPPVKETLTMAKSAIQKIAMNPSENIAYDKLVLSQENVRRVKTASPSSSSPPTSAGASSCRA
jgi:ParB family chromosome partitioning protein